MELRQLSTFCAVVESGSVTGASRRLGYAQSTVTAHVQALEASVGMPLFARGGKRLALTSTGREAYDRARVVMRGVDDLRGAIAGVREGIAGDVRLGAIESAASARLPGPVARFLKERPGVHVRFEVGGTATLAQRLSAGDLDLVIAAMPQDAGGDLAFDSLYVDKLVLLVSRDSKLGARRSVGMRELAAERILLTSATCSHNAVLREAAARAGVALDVALESANVPTIVRAVQMGMGAAVLRIEDGRLRVTIGLLRAARPESMATRALAAALAADLRSAKR
jgi:DNA-binding transcriptional LysR family regulator